MVNSGFEARRRPDSGADANTDEFIVALPDSTAHAVSAFTVGVQGGMPGYGRADDRVV